MRFPDVSSTIENKCHQLKSEILEVCTKDGCVELATVASVVKAYSGTLIPLVRPKSYHVRVCGQDETVYCGNEDQLESWEDHYLPERMKMQVIGAIDDFPCDAFCRQLVLLLCEDGNIYAYEDEVLHLVAISVRELFESGMTFPGIESFKFGECFEDYTEEEYNEIMDFSEIKEVGEAHKKFRESLEHKLLESLTELKNRQLKNEQEVEERAVWSRTNSDNMIIGEPNSWGNELYTPVPMSVIPCASSYTGHSLDHNHSNSMIPCTGS